jgi:hypothetical protein
MKLPAVRIAARETLLAAVAEGFPIDLVKKRMWQRHVPPIVWRDEISDLQITIDDDGRLRLPPKVVVIPPSRASFQSDRASFGNKAS